MSEESKAKTCFVIIYYINLSEIIGDFVYLR